MALRAEKIFEFYSWGFTLVLGHGSLLNVPWHASTRLLAASEDARRNLRFIGGGVGIHWPDIDEDLSVERLFDKYSDGKWKRCEAEKESPDHSTCRHCKTPISWDEYSYTHDENGFAECGVAITGSKKIGKYVVLDPEIRVALDAKRAEPVEWGEVS